MSFRPRQTQHPDYAALQQMQQQQFMAMNNNGPYETETGFALTSNGAIGFAQEIENKLAVANSVIQATQQAAQVATPLASAPEQKSSGVQSNRDAYSRMQITCESIVDKEPLNKSRMSLYQQHDDEDLHDNAYLESDDHEHHQEMHRLASLFEPAAGVYGVETGIDALSRIAFDIHHNTDVFSMEKHKSARTMAKMLAKQWQIYRVFRQKLNLIHNTTGKSHRAGKGEGLKPSINVFRAYEQTKSDPMVSQGDKDEFKGHVNKLMQLWDDLMIGMPEKYKQLSELNPKTNLWKAVQEMMSSARMGSSEARFAVKKERILEEIYKKYAAIIAFIEQKGLPHRILSTEEARARFSRTVMDEVDSIRKRYEEGEGKERKKKRKQEKKEQKKMAANKGHKEQHSEGHGSSDKALEAMAAVVKDSHKAIVAMATNVGKMAEGNNKKNKPKNTGSMNGSTTAQKTATPSSAPPKSKPKPTTTATPPGAAAAAGAGKNTMQMQAPKTEAAKMAPFGGTDHHSDFCTCEQPIPMPITHAAPYTGGRYPNNTMPMTTTSGPFGFTSKKAAKKAAARQMQMQMQMQQQAPMMAWQPVVPMTGAAPAVPYGYAPMTAAPAVPYGYPPMMYQ